jgi:SpoVK/Ycf46/Vps4 family AAA+-type ATPase
MSDPNEPDASGGSVRLPVGSGTDFREHIIETAFGRYVTRNSGFRTSLEGVRAQIEVYLHKTSVKRPLNILLAAPPGSGKSFLIKQLIESIDFKNRGLEASFEESYVASLENSAELYGIFQRVQSINLEGGKLPVVFFDEIDATVNGGKLFARFLAPMWDGTFYIGKEKFFLGRSIFFFAGSNLSGEDFATQILVDHNKMEPMSYDEYLHAWRTKFDERNKNAPDKLPDFLDRIDEILLIPPIRKELLGNDLEKEYEELACVMIKKHHPQVKLVGKLALQIITDILKNSKSVRPAEKVVFNSHLEDPETFDLRCLPKKHQYLMDDNKNAFGEDGREKSGWQVSIEAKKDAAPKNA